MKKPIILFICFVLIIQLACGSEVLRKRVADSVDSSGNAVDLAFGITQDLYAHKKISADIARKTTLGLQKANVSVEAAGKRALEWIAEVEAQEKAAKERGEKFTEPKAVPENVRADIEKLLDQAALALNDIGDITNEPLLKQISRILQLINTFRRNLKGVL